MTLTQLDLSILKYYKEGNELCGFEKVHDNLCKLDFLNYDLELTNKGKEFINSFDFYNIKTYNNEVLIKIKPVI
jgi:hypothetical protein